jgi:methionyl-tRNA synthetase
MTASRLYLTTTIPYVNARPHLGFALELVQADVLARHQRQRGNEVRFLTGTDDNSLKNVLAAEAEGLPTQELVDRNATAFEALREPLALSFDDFIRTSRDPRHRPGVERFWKACAGAGDLYRKHYEGMYCVGCEQFYTPAELRTGRCPEHNTEPQLVAEENWFFRLSRYQEQLHDLIASGRLRVEPAARRNEVLGFITAGLQDFSISRSRTRARGWGIPVPDDPDQVIYVWWDALGNYVTALDYGHDGQDYQRWWVHGDRRVHLLGKGVLRSSPRSSHPAWGLRPDQTPVCVIDLIGSAGTGTGWVRAAVRTWSGTGRGRCPSARPGRADRASGRPASPTRRSGPGRPGRGR